MDSAALDGNLSETLSVMDVMDMNPAVKTYPHQRSLSCYGRGIRLQDIQVPRLPRSLAAACDDNNKTNTPESGKGRKSRLGRGRGKGRKSEVQDENQLQSESPNGLQDYAHLKKSYTYSGSSSGSSYASGPECAYSSPRHGSMRDGVPSDSSPLRVDGTGPEISEPSTNPESPPMVDGDGWTVEPPCVCQLGGIPLSFDIKIIYELLSSYGTIIDCEEKREDGFISMRVKFSNVEICESIEANIDNSDFSGTGSVVTCKHLKS